MQYGFLCQHKSYPVLGEHSLRFEKCCFLALINTNDSAQKNENLPTGVEVMVTSVNALAMSYRRLVGAKEI